MLFGKEGRCLWYQITGLYANEIIMKGTVSSLPLRPQGFITLKAKINQDADPVYTQCRPDNFTIGGFLCFCGLFGLLFSFVSTVYTVCTYNITYMHMYIHTYACIYVYSSI